MSNNSQENSQNNGYDPTPFDYESISLNKYMYDTNSIITEILRELHKLNNTMVYIAQQLDKPQEKTTKEQAPLMGLNTIKSN